MSRPPTTTASQDTSAACCRQAKGGREEGRYAFFGCYPPAASPTHPHETQQTVRPTTGARRLPEKEPPPSTVEHDCRPRHPPDSCPLARVDPESCSL